MNSVLFTRECCSTPWTLQPPAASSNFSGAGNSRTRRVHSSVSGPSSSSLIGRKLQFEYNLTKSLDPVNSPASSLIRYAPGRSGSRPRWSSTLRALECRNRSSGAFLPTLRLQQGRKLRFRVRAEQESGNGAGSGDEEEKEEEEEANGGGVGDKASEGRLSRWRNGISTSVMHFLQEFSRELKNETGFDSELAKDRLLGKYQALRDKSGEVVLVAKEELQNKVEEARDQVTSSAEVVQHRYWPQFVNWNRRELWQDRTQWDAQRVGAFVLYALLFGSFLRGAHVIATTPRVSRKDIDKLADAYLESVFPEPTPGNVRKFMKATWQENLPEALHISKYKLGDDGEYHRDFQFPGEDPEKAGSDINFDANKWIDKSELFTAEEKEQLKREFLEANSRANLEHVDAEDGVRVRVDINDFIDELDGLTPEEREQAKIEIGEEKARQASDSSQASSSQGWDLRQPGVGQAANWQERLDQWDEIFQEETLKEALDSATSKYVAEINLPEVEAQIKRKHQDEAMAGKSMRAFWVARKWWKYRPKLPYTYLLDKIEKGEVSAAVYTDDMKKLYVKMKEGFPTDYVVDLPVDPTLYELLQTHGVELDVLHRSDILYYGRILLALLPSLLLIWYIRQLQYQGREKASEKIYDLLSMNREHLILPEDAKEKARSQYKDVVVGGDIWQVIDEIMIYMRNPMKYHNRRVKLPRGILISGPPGTGKTLLARAIARESGLPFVFASGAEFVESGTGTGTDKAPSFVFIDEIDALAGKNAKDDAERRATFEQLLSELDGEPEDTDVDRFARRQAVILICATNRPDELDEDFMKPGRIDREIHIGLPGEEEREGIFQVHSQGKRISKDVDFSKLVFRTLGYSGADIRNLINEAGIMAVRKGHDEISQQDLTEVLDKQLFEGMGVVLMDEEQKRAEEKIPAENKRLLAVHEAGHVLLAHLFPSFDWHAFSHLLPGGSESALSVFYPRQDMLQLGHTTVGYVMMQMVVAHGGRCAERLVYGDNISDGGQDDLARISAMARELTISPANTRLGLLPIKWREAMDPPKLPGEVELIPNEWDKQGTHIINMSVELSELFTREVTKVAEETEEIAMAALSQNRHILDRLAEVLLSKTKLSGFEAEDIIRSMNPIFLPDFMNDGVKIDLKAFEERPVPPKMAGRYEELNIYPAPLHRS